MIEAAAGTMAMEATTEAAAETPTETPTETGDAFSIPEDYKDAAWTQGLDSNEAVWKKLAGSQKLIGDRGAFIPQEGATDAEVEAFLERLDPMSDKLKERFADKAPEAYEWGELELPEGVTVPEGNTEKFSELAKELGLSNDKANALRKNWIEFETQQAIEKAQAMETEFEEMAKGLWGDEWTTVTAEASEVLKSHVPEEMREQMINMPNKYLVPLVATMKSIAKDKPDVMPSSSQTTTMDKEQLRAKYKELRQKASSTQSKQDVAAYHAFIDENRHKL